MARGLRWAMRVVIVCTGAFALVVAGQALLHANAAVRPMWSGPNALAIARTQLATSEAAARDAQQLTGQLQGQVQQLTTDADALEQLLVEAGVAGGFGAGGGTAAPVSRRNRRGGEGDDGF